VLPQDVPDDLHSFSEDLVLVSHSIEIRRAMIIDQTLSFIETRSIDMSEAESGNGFQSPTRLHYFAGFFEARKLIN